MKLNRADFTTIRRNVTVNDNGCWIWTGELSRNGYPRITLTNGTPTVAHRAMYEYARGPIPDGLQAEHACHTLAFQRGECQGGSACTHRRCVNPDHIELLTPSENTDRQAHANRLKTHCTKGHPYDDGNTYVDSTGRRHCRTCRSERNRKGRPAAADTAAPDGRG